MWITLSLLGLWRRTCFIHLWLSGAPHLIGCYGEDGHRVATVHLSHHRVLTHPAQQLHAVYRWDTNTHTHCQNRVMGKDESSFFKVPYPTTPFLKPSSSYTHLQSSQNSLRLRATKVYCHFFLYQAIFDVFLFWSWLFIAQVFTHISPGWGWCQCSRISPTVGTSVGGREEPHHINKVLTL